MTTLARILAQLVIAGPVIFYAPWAFLVGIGTIALLVSGETPGVSKMLGYGLGWIGLVGLYGSILTPLRIIRAHGWLRVAMASAIVCGFIATAAILSEERDPVGFLSRGGWFTAYLLLGPVVVGGWNLVRILGKGPNEAARTATGASPGGK